MKNPFSQKTRKLFIDKYDCGLCGMNQNLELHHILGRVSNSPLNGSPVCHKCHKKINLSNKEITSKLLASTLEYLLLRGYILTDKDKRFIGRFKDLYLSSVLCMELLKWQNIKI